MHRGLSEVRRAVAELNLLEIDGIENSPPSSPHRKSASSTLNLTAVNGRLKDKRNREPALLAVPRAKNNKYPTLENQRVLRQADSRGLNDFLQRLNDKAVKLEGVVAEMMSRACVPDAADGDEAEDSANSVQTDKNSVRHPTFDNTATQDGDLARGMTARDRSVASEVATFALQPDAHLPDSSFRVAWDLAYLVCAFMEVCRGSCQVVCYRCVLTGHELQPEPFYC